MNKVDEIYLKRAEQINQFYRELKLLLKSKRPLNQKLVIQKQKFESFTAELFRDDVKIRQVYEPLWQPCNCKDCKLVLFGGYRK